MGVLGRDVPVPASGTDVPEGLPVGGKSVEVDVDLDLEGGVDVNVEVGVDVEVESEVAVEVVARSFSSLPTVAAKEVFCFCSSPT